MTSNDETADLRAEVERLREGAASCGIHWAQEKRRAEAAEAKVARVEAILDEWAEKAARVEPSYGQQLISVGHIVTRFRAALDGDA